MTDCREVLEAEEKLIPSQSYCQSWGCSWAQHSTAPANFKENPRFSTPFRKHCRIGPLGKDFPEGEIFQLREGPVASQGQEPGQGNATSWQPPQGPEDTTKLLGGFGTCFFVALG